MTNHDLASLMKVERYGDKKEDKNHNALIAYNTRNNLLGVLYIDYVYEDKKKVIT